MAFNKLRYKLFGRRGRGFIRQGVDSRDYVYKTSRKSKPASVDLSDDYQITIKDQKWTNACTGFAASYVMEILAQKLTKMKYEISPLYLWYFGKLLHGWADENNGVWLRNTLKAIYQFGFVPEDAFKTQSDYLREVPTGVLQAGLIALAHILKEKTEYQLLSASQVKDALANKNPVVCGVMVNSSFDRNRTGYISDAEPGSDSHAITIVGYFHENGKNYLKFVNSWGNWGDDGYGYLTQEYLDKHSHDLWTVVVKK